MERLGERTLLIDCDVIQADAGTRTASITGAWLALDQACRSLVEQGVLEQSPLVDQVAAVSVGLVDGQALLDLDYSEDSRAEVDLNVCRPAMAVFWKSRELRREHPSAAASSMSCWIWRSRDCHP